MGDHSISNQQDLNDRLIFTRHLLDDIKSLEIMLSKNLIEDNITRLGAEQEFCLVDKHWRPADNSLKVLESVNDPHFTTELAKYNLEINLDPVKFDNQAFTAMKSQLEKMLEKAHLAAGEHETKVVLSGILPSISKHEVNLNYMTPVPRYYALNDLLTQNRGGDFKMHLAGVDELSIRHNTVMFEACNTSFQMHYQISPHEFTQAYNWAQAIAGPVLAACVNSPLLLGNELWSETRIALFRQSIDTRQLSQSQFRKNARVTFGNKWVDGSIVDFFRDEISSYRILLTKEIEQSSLQKLKEGTIPKLEALNLFNGNIYRWNRLCYGVGGGKPHMRIENRYIPSGPSLKDEMANFAFWAGLMAGRPKDLEISAAMPFEQAKNNFIKAARYGTDTFMYWEGRKYALPQLIQEVFIPIAQNGLMSMGITESQINEYLNIIESRILNQTGSEWTIRQFRKLKLNNSTDQALISLTRALHENQISGSPLKEWKDVKPAQLKEDKPDKLSHIMNTRLVTAHTTDSALLTLNYMKWNNIHHLPVVNEHEELQGIITWTHLEKLKVIHEKDPPLAAKDIMVKDVIQAPSNLSINEGIQRMKKHMIGCLPITNQNQLVGIVTIKDILPFTDDSGTQSSS